MTRNIDFNTPIACLTFGQFIEAFKAVNSEPIPPKKELPKYLTVPELAELTGYSKSTINIYNSEKKIPGSRKLNGRVLFETQTILDWIESGAVKAKSERLAELDKQFKEGRA